MGLRTEVTQQMVQGQQEYPHAKEWGWGKQLEKGGSLKSFEIIECRNSDTCTIASMYHGSIIHNGQNVETT